MSTSESKRDLSSLPTPTIPASKAVVHVAGSTHIKAPITQVWDALIDTSTWPEWNSFIPRVAIRAQPDTNNADNKNLSPVLQLGTKMTFYTIMDAKKPEKKAEAPLIVEGFEPPSPDLESGRRIARVMWFMDHDSSVKGSYAHWLLHPERVHELEELGGDEEGWTEVRTWEAQTGLLAYVVKALYGSILQREFQTWVENLKAFVEGKGGVRS